MKNVKVQKIDLIRSNCKKNCFLDRNWQLSRLLSLRQAEESERKKDRSSFNVTINGWRTDSDL